MEPVRTHRSKSVVEAARLHRGRARAERGLTLVEGPALLHDVIQAGATVAEVFGLEGSAGTTRVNQAALARLAGTESPRGPVAVVEIPRERLDPGRDLLVSVGVSDPGNVGTMIRTAAAFGWGFAYLEGTADPWAPKVIRAGAGGQFQTPVTGLPDLDAIEGFVTVAAVAHDGSSPSEVTSRPVALLIGAESSGLSDDVIRAATYRMTIPTPGVTESLNAAVAAGIAIYELSKGTGESGADV
jgi:TrmH family RNA methyltransferase